MLWVDENREVDDYVAEGQATQPRQVLVHSVHHGWLQRHHSRIKYGCTCINHTYANRTAIMKTHLTTQHY